MVDSASCCSDTGSYSTDSGPLQSLLPVLGAPGLLTTSEDQDLNVLLLDIIAGARRLQDHLSVSADGPCSLGPITNLKCDSDIFCFLRECESGPDVIKGLEDDLPILRVDLPEQKATFINGSPNSGMSSSSAYGTALSFDDVAMCCEDENSPTAAHMQHSKELVSSWLACTSPASMSTAACKAACAR